MFHLSASLFVHSFFHLLVLPIARREWNESVRWGVGIEHSDIKESSFISSSPESTDSNERQVYPHCACAPRVKTQIIMAPAAIIDTCESSKATVYNILLCA